METLQIVLVWAPDCSEGEALARHVTRCFDSLGMVRLRKRVGVPVRVRSRPLAVDGAPGPIHFDAAENTLVVFLADRLLGGAYNGPWRAYLDDILARARSAPGADPEAPRVETLLVALSRGGFDTGLAPKDQAYSFVDQDGRTPHVETAKQNAPTEPTRMLILTLICVARALLAKRRAARAGAVCRPLSLFISHTKRTGRPVARALNNRLRALNLALAGSEPFLDEANLQYGADFKASFERNIENGMLFVVYTDDYATRQFCQWEMLFAKRRRRPILVSQLLRDGESRTFPYSGNTPLMVFPAAEDLAQTPPPPAPPPAPERSFWPWRKARSRPSAAASQGAPEGLRDTPHNRRLIDELLLAALSEALRFELFEHDAERAARRAQLRPAAIFARPPELVDVATLKDPETPATGEVAIYPDPPLDTTELRLVEQLAAPFVMRTLAQVASGELEGGAEAGGSPRLTGRVLSISVSDPPAGDPPRIGYQPWRAPGALADEPWNSAITVGLAEIVTVAAQLGGRLAYGGDLRPGGFTKLLFREVADAYRTLELNGGSRGMVNQLPLMVWRAATVETLLEHIEHMQGAGEVRLFLEDGAQIAAAMDGRLRLSAPEASTARALVDALSEIGGGGAAGDRAVLEALFERTAAPRDAAGVADALTKMRAAQAQEEDARLALGGGLAGSGRYPGVLEEIHLSIDAGKLALPVAAFGGAAHDAAVALGLCAEKTPRKAEGRAAHPRYPEIIALLEGQRGRFADIVAAHGLSLEAVRGFIRLDAPGSIATGLRRLVREIRWPDGPA